MHDLHAPYVAASARYEVMTYKRCGRSGLQLPRISLGLWHNFGGVDSFARARELVRTAFDLGITHFDLANNYGPPPGSAESTLGALLRSDLAPYRDELIISTKAGYDMWPGPYGNFGSRKYLIASLDQSLRRLGLDYVDIYYHHRPDPQTPLAETMGALAHAVRSGKALYVGLSNYNAADTREAVQLLRAEGVTCLIHQPSYNILRRDIERELLGEVEELGLGCIAFSPLAQGLLTDRYLEGIPSDSRAANPDSPFLDAQSLTQTRVEQLRGLAGVAKDRGQSLAQMSLAWILQRPAVTSALVGASQSTQLRDSVQALENLTFSEEELRRISELSA